MASPALRHCCCCCRFRNLAIEERERERSERVGTASQLQQWQQWQQSLSVSVVQSASDHWRERIEGRKLNCCTRTASGSLHQHQREIYTTPRLVVTACCHRDTHFGTADHHPNQHSSAGPLITPSLPKFLTTATTCCHSFASYLHLSSCRVHCYNSVIFLLPWLTPLQLENPVYSFVNFTTFVFSRQYLFKGNSF